MAVLRYKDENGVYHDIVGIIVQNEVVQATGTSTTAVMSQNAVTNVLSGKADLSATVSDVAYDSSTGKLKKTVNGETTNVCDVVTAGFRMEYNSTTGIKSLTPIGGATGAFNNSTGIKSITF